MCILLRTFVYIATVVQFRGLHVAGYICSYLTSHKFCYYIFQDWSSLIYTEVAIVANNHNAELAYVEILWLGLNRNLKYNSKFKRDFGHYADLAVDNQSFYHYWLVVR